MKVFLDTNVLASGLATRGLCYDVVRTVFEFHALVISEGLINELERILRDKFDLPEEAIIDAVWLVRQDSLVGTEIPHLKISIKDRDDIPIISAAINGGAEVLVTGDSEIQALNKCGRMKIMSPRQYWEAIRGMGSAR